MSQYEDQKAGSSQAEFIEVVEAFTNAQTWNERKHIVEVQHDKLLTDDADRLLESLLNQHRGDSNATEHLQECRNLLIRCRREGLDSAFADYLPLDGLQTLMNEIRHLDRSIDIPRKVELYQTALGLVNRKTHKRRWARLHENLASSLVENPLGERADNLERAISHYDQALTIYTRQAFPEAWARIRANLGIAYLFRIRGDRVDNLEQAISHCQDALTVYTPQNSPENWAKIQYQQASAYLFRIRGEQADNLEQAISHCQDALTVYTRHAFPKEWAGIRNNLGIAYFRRIRGERALNLEYALFCCQDALTIYTLQDSPRIWTMIQTNFAEIYTHRIHGERADNLERAIFHYEQALTVDISQIFPEDLTRMLNGLAKSYTHRIHGERADNLERAIFHYEQALKVCIRQSSPEDWARIQNNLGIAYFWRIYGTEADNLEQAITCFQQALTVRTPRTFPQDCRDTAYFLGYILYNMSRFTEARRALLTAHRAVEAQRGEMQKNVVKKALAKENTDLYAYLVSCCLQEEDETAAFKYAIASKGRAFIDTLATARLDISAFVTNDPDLTNDLQTARLLRRQIDNLLAALTGERSLSSLFDLSSSGNKALSNTSSLQKMSRVLLQTLQSQEASHWEDMAYKYPALTATQQTPTLSADQARALATELNATLVEYCQHAEGWGAFVVTPEDVDYIPLSLIDDDLLARMKNWVQVVESQTGMGRNRLSYQKLIELHRAVIAPLQDYFPLGKPVVLAPFGELHLLPLAAALDPQTGHYAADDYLLTFAPSLTALRTIRDQFQRTGNDARAGLRCLLSVAYPGSTPDSNDYLPNVIPEAEAIAKYFAQVTPLYHEAASPDAVVAHSRDKDVIHFGCHGWFDPERPEQSGLLLAGGWLTVQRIITELHLSQTRLATLSACLTGRAEIRGVTSISDWYRQC